MTDKNHPPETLFKQIIIDILEAWKAKGLVKAFVLNSGKLTKTVPHKQFKSYCAKTKIEEGKNRIKFTTFLSVYTWFDLRYW